MYDKLWIGGAWVEPAEKGKTAITDPSTGERIAEVATSGAADVDRAVQATKEAFYDGRWSRRPPSERSKAIWKLADLVEAAAPDLARVESRNTGKPYEFLSLGGDLPFSVDNLCFFAGAARDVHGSRAGEFATGYTSLLRREPVGVVGQIAPWNYPLMMAVWKLGPALAAGCTIVFKPAPGTPLTALMLAELTREAGIPDGVVNILPGGNATGQALVAHPDVRLVSLTGSTATGKAIMRSAADTLKRVHLELGGKAPLIVLDDADIGLAAAKAAAAATVNSGQDCTAATRVLAHRSKLPALAEALVEAMRAVKVGLPFESGVRMGPLASAAQRDRAAGFVERARAKGGRVLTGGRVPPGLELGCFYEPTVIAEVGQDWEIVQSEVFGPVLTLQAFEDEAEALAMANGVPYGLAASVFTRDVSRASRLSAALEFGTVWINDHQPITSETPHGGFKQSGFGKDLSAESVGDYLVTKHVMIAL